MITYLSREHITALKPSWKQLISVIEQALITFNKGDFVQPIKPYLRYRDPANRIIAMPAFIGGEFNFAGIKWIASFPDNFKKNLPRAHAITILNESESGRPFAFLSSNELSILRTAAVTGYAIQKFLNQLPLKKLKIGITGFGPIGQMHKEMINEILKDRPHKIDIFDFRYSSCRQDDITQFVNTWEEAYQDADIFITCTTSKDRYINHPPKKGSLQLNISLRDYYPHLVKQSSLIVVDDWSEVCRENTDIEKAFLEHNLIESDTISLKSFTDKELFNEIERKNPLSDGYISFHFMGMAIFDIALSGFFYDKAKKEKIGIILPE